MRRLLLLMGIVLLSTQLFSQQRTIIGKVTDANGNPVPNATIVIKGTKLGTTSGPDGSYTLPIPATARNLVFSGIGFLEVEVSIGNKGVINASLASSDKNLQEVVVVGYGTQKKKELTGSSVAVKGADIAEKPVQSFEAALAGRAAGVQITVPNGVLNTPPVFRIRGTNSISLSSYPLIVVDGVPAFTGDYSSTNSAGNALASINPNDIESIDIGKDAAATAIYGSRAANGVVFITTKKGKSGKAKVNYDAWVGWTKVYRLPDMLNAQQYTDYKNLALSNVPTTPAAYHFATATDANGKLIDTRWFDYIYRQGFSHSNNISVSGGNDNTTYYFSAGYTSQEGIVRKNDFKRINGLFNVDSRINKVITIGGKIAYSNEQNLAATSSGSLSGEAFNTGGLGRIGEVNAPNIAPYKNDGTYNIGPTYVGPMNNVLAATASNTQVGFYNPVVVLDLNRSNNEINHVQSNAYFQLKPLNWITLKTQYGIDYLLVDNDLFWNPFHGDGQSYVGYATSGYGKYKSSLWTTTAQFDYTFADKHNINLLVGSEQQRRTSLGFGLNRQTLSDSAYTLIQAGFNTNNYAALVYGENYLLSSFGRLSYNFNKKYFLTGNLRQDEYSALGQKKGLFWGASAGWEITRENFWESAGLNKVFSSFKIRGSYGKVGNIGGIGDYSPYSSYASSLYGGNATLYFASVGNPQLKWETSTKTDVGFSFGLFKERLTGEVAWYKNDINNLILNVPQSPSAGLPSFPPQNVGTMYNKGLEITLSGTPVATRDFTWNSSFNLTFNTNKVTALAPGLSVIQQSTSGLETVNETAPGYSLGYLWVIRTGGVDPGTGKRIFLNSAGTPVYYSYYVPSGNSPKYYNYSLTADGLTQYTSPVTGGNSITQAADGVLYKNTQPREYGGWSNTFHYKGFDLDVLLTYQAGFYVYYGSGAGLHDQRFWNNATDILNHWSKAGDVSKYPKPIYGDNVSNGSAMPLDINVYKGDFIKLRNLQLSYNLPEKILERIRLSKARFYVSGQNLAIRTQYPGPDPEVSSNAGSNTSQGVDRNSIANGRTITVGVNVGF